MVSQLVSATLDVYKNAMSNLLPTPTKSHYLFNLRDFGRVIQVSKYIQFVLLLCNIIQGVLLGNSTTVSDIDSMKRLWTHEVLRVYYDRLVDDADRKWLIEYLHTCTAEQFQTDFNTLFKHLDFNKDGTEYNNYYCVHNVIRHS